MDINKPRVCYTLISADRCECAVVYQRVRGKVKAVIEGEWSPHYPDDHTDFVNIEIQRGYAISTSIEISGDDHRDLEGNGLLDDFIGALLDGESANAAMHRLVGHDIAA
jgi:hypothetical protein